MGVTRDSVTKENGLQTLQSTLYSDDPPPSDDITLPFAHKRSRTDQYDLTSTLMFKRGKLEKT